MTNSKKAKRFQFWINVVLILITLSIVLPFVLVFISSLTDENTLIRNGYSFFPEKFSFYAYSYIIRQGEKILRAYGITVFVTIVGTAANIAMSALLAYPLSVKKLPYRRAITFFVFFTMLFNGGLVPTYLMYVNYLHIKNTIWALIVPGFLLSANNVLMIRSYFNTSIPDALFEAAKIDGAGHMKIFTSITLPLGKPILVTMGLFSALGYWNDWTNGLYYLSGNEGQKLYSIQNLLNQMITDIQYLASGKVTGNIGAEVAKLPTTSIRMAIAFIAMLPLFIMAIENDTDRQFVAGLYQRHRDFLLRCAQKILNDPDRAEEALHEAMLRVIRSLERVRQIPAEELLPYLVTIVQTASIDLYHKTNRERQAAQGRERDWAESLSGTEDTELLLIRREQAELLRECLKTLPQREIDLLNYAYTLELSTKEITRLTGLAPGNVRQILTRARRKVLATYIEKGGMNHE